MSYGKFDNSEMRCKQICLIGKCCDMEKFERKFSNFPISRQSRNLCAISAFPLQSCSLFDRKAHLFTSQSQFANLLKGYEMYHFVFLCVVWSSTVPKFMQILIFHNLLFQLIEFMCTPRRMCSLWMQCSIFPIQILEQKLVLIWLGHFISILMHQPILYQ